MMDRLAETLPIARWLEHGILAAVSGGADSMALLHFLARFQELVPNRLAVGHVNHALRGEESDTDAEFVQNAADEYGLPYFEHRITPEEWNTGKIGSREAAARQIRYSFLTRTAEQLGFRYVATAHTADDQTETVLHRFLRGTGVSGLVGMSQIRQLNPAVTLIRPVLEVRHHDILTYLERLGKTYRTDFTNFENDFTRNRIRNRLLPMLRDEFNPKVDEAIARLARLAAKNEEVFDELIEDFFEKAVLRQTPNEVILNSSVLRNQSTAMLREFFIRLWKRNGWQLRNMGFEQWNSLVEFFHSETGRYECRGLIVAEHRHEQFILQRLSRLQN